MGIRVIAPGLATTVQDLGRPGYYHLGIPVSGAMDRLSLRAANMLVGNDEGAAALEAVFMGPELEFTGDATVADPLGADAEGDVRRARPYSVPRHIRPKTVLVSSMPVARLYRDLLRVDGRSARIRSTYPLGAPAFYGRGCGRDELPTVEARGGGRASVPPYLAGCRQAAELRPCPLTGTSPGISKLLRDTGRCAGGDRIGSASVSVRLSPSSARALRAAPPV